MNKSPQMSFPKRAFSIIVLIVAFLCLPLILMQFTDEIYWTSADFLAMAGILLGFWLFLEILYRFVHKKAQRILVGFIVLIVFILIWAELAVGIFNSPFAGN
ncbi:hypothetical protein [Flavobacterium sp.]|uniref:hypothetical protein n=1 Tax=Flavobacterium sp. TaxID=239 RepID=UPI002632D7B1|nr:hypothetical protein [Flavobacterium sp.]